MRALVVGGGIGGVSAAIALRRAGLEVDVFEKVGDPTRTQVGGGFHLWGNAVRAVRELGLEEKVRGIGATIERTEFHSSTGRQLAVWPVAEVSGAVGATDFGVSRAELQRTLHGSVGDGIVRSGAELTEFSQDEEGVTATFADGREERGDLLVGADGIRSTVRAQLLGAAPPDYAGYTQWQTVTAGPSDLIDHGTERVTFGRGLRTVVHHVGGGRLFWAAVTYGPEADAGRPPGRKEMLLRRFGSWPAPITEAIDGTPEEDITGLAVFDRQPVKRWGEGRLTLLGDAAHPMTTNTSQGGNQAIEDAVILARCLGEESDVAHALRRYEDQRIPRTSPLVKRSRSAARMNAWSDPVRCRFRDVLFSFALQRPALSELRETVAGGV